MPLHILSHGAVMAEADIGNIFSLQEWLGHSDISTTSNIYTQLNCNSV